MSASDQEHDHDFPDESPLMDPLLMGEKILNKKAVYEPSSSQRCRQLVCSRRWAVAILVTMGLFLLLIAIIAAFARPGSMLCQNLTGGQSGSQADTMTTAAPPTKEKTYISSDGRPFPWKNIRLPRSVLPDSYKIFLHPNISQSVFSGNVTIHSSVVSSTDFFLFHIKDLNVSQVRVLRGEVEVEVEDQMEYKDNQQYYVKLRDSLESDSKITIVVEFRGALVKKLAGFYKSSYKTAAGETREIATTHFEPTDARTAFPCFDEPDLKANFSLSIVREKRHVTLFNMPLESTIPYEDDLLQDDYQTSVKMSTYLVAFVVCDFKNVSGRTNDNTLVRVFAPEDQINQASYAVDTAVKVLNYYNEFFGVPYPLPKQDMIAIPDFAAGAMENWGLITYRMTSILYDPQKTSPFSKQWITTVIAHELAHQWFGNIVTMKWWDDLWLNEGFASFVEYLGSQAAEPSFQMREQFVYESLQNALYLDSFANSHPIQVPVTDPAQINEIFDKISYDKGASLIAMAQDFIGADNFQKGLQGYLKDHSYGNAQTADLWDSLQKASTMDKTGLTVKEVMDTWTLQMGYPVVTVKRKPGTTDQLVVSQSRFLMGKESSEDKKFESPFNYVWKVPFSYITQTDPAKKLVWLTEEEMTLPLTLGENNWIKANVGSRGYYRVNYEPSLWQLIIKQLRENMTVFSAQDRAGLLDDAFALARAGLLTYEIVFDLLGYFNQERDYVPLQTAFDQYRFIGQRMYLTDTYPKLQKYMQDLISGCLDRLGWKEQTQHLDKLLQSSVLSFAIGLDDKNTIQQVKQQFTNLSGVSNNLKSLVYNMGVKYGDDETWQSIFKNFTTSTVPTEKKQFLVALTYTTDPRRIQLFLRDSLNKDIVRSQDTETVIRGFGAKKAGHIFAWRFLQENWDIFYDRYGQTSFILEGIFNGVIAPFNTQFDCNEVTQFFKGKELGSGRMGLKQSLETVQTHIDWMKNNEEIIAKWFTANMKDV